MKTYLKKAVFFAFAALVILLRWQFALPKFDENYIGSYRGQKVSVIGVIQEPSDGVSITAFEYFNKKYSMQGFIKIRLPALQEIKYGDNVSIRGLLEAPSTNDPRIGGFVKMPYIKIISSGEGSAFFALLYHMRDFFVGRLNNVFPEPSSSLAAALLLGSRTEIPRDILLDFKKVGLTHVIALSGFNIAILIGFIATALSVVPHRAANISAIIVVAVFVLLTGASASVVRAGIMGSLSLIARLFGRKAAGLRTLFITGYFMVLLDPFILVYDIGFQLSFAATFGIMLFVERWKKRLERIPNTFALRDSFLTTSAAQLTTFPLIIFYFKGFSVIATVANLIVLPAIPLLMLGSFLSLLFGKIIAAPTWLLFSAMLKIVHFFASLPFAFIDWGSS